MAAAHRSVRRVARTVGAGILTALLTTGSVSAQDLEPRAYSPSPVGTTFLVVTATRSTGGVLTDPSIPLTDVEAQLELGGVGVGHSFALLGKSALVLGAVPVTWATVRGEVGENQHEASRRGLADPRVKLSMILAGSKPMTPAEFARAPRRPIVGASLTVAPPIGQYDPAKLINLGSNRWAFKPEVGVSTAHGRWVYEGAFGVWLYSRNSKFPGGFLRTQSPLLSTQAHIVRLVRQRHWIAFDTSYFAGAIGRVDGIKKSTNQSSLRVGLTYGLIFSGRQSVRFSYFDTTLARLGGNTQSFGVAYQFLWATGR